MASAHPVTILVQGGIASGKSTIGRLLAARGAAFLDCDRIAHEVLADPEVEAAVREAFGPGVIRTEGRAEGGPEGRVDRRALGRVVFDDPAALARLEALVHPRVRDRVQAALAALPAGADGRRPVAVIDAAVASKMRLLGDDDYDVVVFVDVSPETRRRRALERGWAPGELERREARQESLAVLRGRADVVVSNDGDLREAESHVERVWSGFVEPRR
ncbi:MAG: dephospho-CoA kinase [Planctomycetes bacterium]|nr:dephospho-CoA kinase [Planctomycetota bacterium]